MKKGWRPLHYRMLDPYATLVESVSYSLVRNMHTSSLLKVILEGSGNAPAVPPYKGADKSPAVGLLPFYNPVQLSLFNSSSSGISPCP